MIITHTAPAPTAATEKATATDAGALAAELLARIGAGDPGGISELFAAEVDWHIAENPPVPWIRPRRTRADVAAHFRELAAGQTPLPEGCAVEAVTVHGDEALVSGRLAGRVRHTGKVFRTPFALRIGVADGLIVRYRVVEDALAVAAACTPDTPDH
jgi:uncharacterized protein